MVNVTFDQHFKLVNDHVEVSETLAKEMGSEVIHTERKTRDTYTTEARYTPTPRNMLNPDGQGDWTHYPVRTGTESYKVHSFQLETLDKVQTALKAKQIAFNANDFSTIAKHVLSLESANKVAIVAGYMKALNESSLTDLEKHKLSIENTTQYSRDVAQSTNQKVGDYSFAFQNVISPADKISLINLHTQHINDNALTRATELRQYAETTENNAPGNYNTFMQQKRVEAENWLKAQEEIAKKQLKDANLKAAEARQKAQELEISKQQPIVQTNSVTDHLPTVVYALKHGKYDIALEAAKVGHSLDNSNDKREAFLLAAIHGATAVMQEISSKASDLNDKDHIINARNADGKRAAHLLIENGHPAEALATLHQLGARMDLRDNHDNTPMDVAIRSKQNASLEKLLELGVEKGYETRNRKVVIAAEAGNTYAVRLIHQYGPHASAAVASPAAPQQRIASRL